MLHPNLRIGIRIQTFFGNAESGSGSDDKKERLGVYKEMLSILADQ
jgi:hypothetical protein